MEELDFTPRREDRPSFPPELVVSVLECLTRDKENGTIHNYEWMVALATIARSSTLLNALAEPLLYRHLVLSDSSIGHLLYAILARPVRRTYVRSLQISWKYGAKSKPNYSEAALFFELAFDHYMTNRFKASLEPLLDPPLREKVDDITVQLIIRQRNDNGIFQTSNSEDMEAARRHGLSASFMRALSAGSYSAQTTVLLYELPMLEKVHIIPDSQRNYWFWSGFPLPQQSLAPSSVFTASLSSITELEIDAELDASKVAVCMQLPKLRRLCIRTTPLFSSPLRIPALAKLRNTASVTDLEIRNLGTGPMHICTLLDVPRGLTRLRFLQDVMSASWDDTEYALFGDALRRLYSLTHLEIVDWHQDLNIDIFGPLSIGSLHGLDKLTHVGIPATLLFGDVEERAGVLSLTTKLPTSVKEFDMQDDDCWRLEGPLSALLSFLPQLQVIYCACTSDDALVDACKSNSVDLRNGCVEYEIGNKPWFWRWP